MTTLSIRNLTRRLTPKVPFARIAKEVLPGWEVSLVFHTEAAAKKLNTTLRKKTYVPNVLSYVSGDKSGEVIICLAEAKLQAPEHGLSYPGFTALLFIHALLHLKGMPHGTTMEKRERALVARYVPIHGTTHSNRHRHRNTPNKSGGGRGGARR